MKFYITYQNLEKHILFSRKLFCKDSSEILQNRLISNIENIYKFHQEYTLNYYKKSIELKLKTLFVNKELFI